MANPQTENGYTRIANDLLAAIIKANLPGTQLAAVLWVIRESYGWNRKWTPVLSTREISKAMNRPDHSTIVRALQVLSDARVLERDDLGRWRLNKDYDSWQFATGGAYKHHPQVVPTSTGSGAYKHQKAAAYKEFKDSKDKQHGEGGGSGAYKHHPASPRQQFLDPIFREYFGLKPGDPDPKERSAVSAAYKRWGTLATEIMSYSKDDPAMARRGFNAIGRRMDSRGLDWGLGAVAKHFLEWMSSPEAYEKETVRQSRR